MKCRFCNTELSHLFASLGVTPLANSYLSKTDLGKMEPFFPLEAYVCSDCFLVQLNEFESPENIFSDYAYFSSYSNSWLSHIKNYCDMVTQRFGLNENSFVMEIASNDGYLLKNFVANNIPVLGIEPAKNVAEIARKNGVQTEVAFFGTETADRLVKEKSRADLIAANNVLAHVPDLNDFVQGIKRCLADTGVVTIEFPHLVQLIKNNQFDTIYHEHFSYFSFWTVEKVFQQHGLELFDVEEIPVHGGSLRIFAKHQGSDTHAVSPRVLELRQKEADFGITQIDRYLQFDIQIQQVKRNFLTFLIQAKEDGKRVVAYGAPAKGNTLLNYCGVKTDLIEFTVDLSIHKQEKYLPGVRIPINAPEEIVNSKPDYVVILPWNIRDEISNQMSAIKEWGGKFVVAIPNLEIF